VLSRRRFALWRRRSKQGAGGGAAVAASGFLFASGLAEGEAEVVAEKIES